MKKKAWYDDVDASTLQRIKTYSAFNDAESKNLMVQKMYEYREEEIAELREKNEGFKHILEKMRAMGFPTFASVKEYAAKLNALELQVEKLSAKKGCMNCGNISCPNNKKRDCAGCSRYISPEDKIKEYEAQVEKMKSIGRTSYIKGIRTMANALKDYDSTDGAWTDYFEHTVDKVLKKLLKEIKEND